MIAVQVVRNRRGKSMQVVERDLCIDYTNWLIWLEGEWI